MNFANLHHMHVNFKDEIIELYSARILRAFGYALIAIFIPIYLLNLGYSFQIVLMFFLMKYILIIIMSPLVGVFQRFFGLKHTMMLSTVFLVIFFILLYSIVDYNWNILLLGALSGFELTLFWIPMNSDFSIHMKKDKTGSETGLLVIIPRIAAVIAPFIGALIIINYEFNVLLIAACLIIISSIFPLFLTKDKHYKMMPISKLFSKHNNKYFWIFFSKGIIAATMLLWPLFIFFTVKDYMFVGGLATLQALAGIAVGLLIGKFSDKTNPIKLFKKIALLSFLIWSTAIFISGPFLITIYSFLLGISFVAFCIPTFAFICKDSYHKNMIELMVYREIILSISRALVIIIAIILPFEIMFQSLFALSAVASFSLLLFKEK